MNTRTHGNVLMITWLFLAGSVDVALAAPAGGVIVAGSGSITPNGAVTDIQQNTNTLVINWQSFTIQAGEQVNFIQPLSSSMALNRDFSGVPSEIFGALNANGQVYLLNTAGILIGPGASVNVAGLFLSDMTVTDSEFERFSQTGAMTLTDSDARHGGIRIEGAITTSTRNGITLISQFIDNSGSLTANDGDINLAIAGGPIVVTDAGGSIGVQVSEGIVRNLASDGVLLDNSGDMRAINGNIHINIQYLSSLNVQAVRNTGLINAVGIGYGEINQTIVLQPPPLAVDDRVQADDVLSEVLGNEHQDDWNEAVAERPTDGLTALDNLIEDCKPDNPQDKECEKQRAIKRYLGRLLIGGSLPE